METVTTILGTVFAGLGSTVALLVWQVKTAKKEQSEITNGFLAHLKDQQVRTDHLHEELVELLRETKESNRAVIVLLEAIEEGHHK